MRNALGALLLCAITSPLFAQAKLSRGEVLEFSATWCGPCQTMSPVVKKLQRQGLPIRKIDIEQYPSLTRNYAVKSIPTFVLLIDGKEADRIVGATTETRIKGLLARIPKPEQTKRATESRADSSSGAEDQSLLSKVNGLIRRRTPAGTPRSSNAPTIRAQNEERSLQPTADLRLANSVRLRIRDAKGTSYGTGTIIQSKLGRSIILTCGHVFRGWSSASKLEIDVFGAGRKETFVGTVVDYDIKAEVGLLAINTSSTLPTAVIAKLEDVIKPGDSVYSVGCGHGNDPTVEQHQVTGIDRYQGFDNIECSGAPVQGRSGGGLFNRKGEIIGTCIGYMDVGGGTMRGLFSGIRAIHRMLDRNELTHLYRGVEPANFDHLIAQPGGPSKPAVTNGSGALESMPAARPIPDNVELPAENKFSAVDASLGIGNSTGANTPALNAAAQRALASASDAEVVCVIRPRDGSASRVVIIDRASDSFVSLLNGELRKSAVRTVKRVTDQETRTDSDEGLVSFASSENPVVSTAQSGTSNKAPFQPRRYSRRQLRAAE